MPIRERKGKWHFRFWVDGHEYSGATDLAATERNRNAALRVEAKARDLVTQGRAHELKLEVHPFNEAAADFLAWADGEHSDHPATARRLRTSFASLSSYFNRQPVSAILRGNVRQYMAWRRQQAIKEVTLRHDLHALSKAFAYWIDLNWARENPVAGVDIPSDRDAIRIHVLTAAEEQLYFTAAARWPNLHDLGRLMILQGCRPEEILALRKADVDLQSGHLTIAKGKSAAARRSLRLTAEARSILAARMGSDGPWVFPSPKRPGLSLAKLNGPHEKALELTRLCKACGRRRLEHGEACEFQPGDRLEFVMYDLRHTFATRAAERGMPIATLAAILGHRDLRSIGKYVHIRNEAMDAAMERLTHEPPKPKATKKWEGLSQ